MAEVKNGKKVVLLAEDDTDQAFLARKMLERQGFVVVTALDGEQALELTEVINPSAMVLDLVMPGIDGFEVLKALKNRPGRRPIVLAVSALRGYLPKARELGADDALRKPYSARVVERLRDLMNGEAPDALAKGETGPPAAARPTEEEPREAEERRSAATQEILELIGGVGSPPEPLLQDLTERSARIFDVRACLISLVTREHDFWPAGCGMPGAPGRVADRESSVCSHTIASRAAIVVHDAEENPFFRDSEARAMGIRFYAGVPLTSRTGESLGSLCLLDHRPRDFSWIELELLGHLAKVAVGTMEWREKAAMPHEPVSSFKHLDMVDPELAILGRDGFNDVLRHLSDRSSEYPDDPDDKVSVVLVDAEQTILVDLVRALRGLFPIAMLGRLGVGRVGVVVVGTDPQGALRLASRAGNGRCRVVAAGAGGGSSSAIEALRRLEGELDQAPRRGVQDLPSREAFPLQPQA